MKRSSFPLLHMLLPMFVILIMAGFLRQYFFTGVTPFDSLLYANSGWELANGEWLFDINSGTRRVGHYLPLAILFSLFGPSESITILWTFGSSLITILLIYGIGRTLAGNRAGLVAAFLWAINPLDVLIATTNYPDGPMAMFGVAAVYFYLLGKRNKLKKRVAYSLSAVFILYGFWVKELIFFVGLFILFWEGKDIIIGRALTLSQVWNKNRSPITLAIFLTILTFIAYGYVQAYSFPEALATTANDMFLALVSNQELAPIFLLFAVSALLVIMRGWQEAYFPVAWFLVTAFIYEWAPITFRFWEYTPNTLFTELRNILFLLPPLAIIAGIAISKLIDHRKYVEIISLVCFLLIITLLGLQNGLLIPERVLLISTISIPVLIFFSLLLPLGTNYFKTKQKWVITGLFLLSLGISVFNPSSIKWGEASTNLDHLRNLKQAAAFIIDQGDYPIYFFEGEDRRSITIFNFYSGYRFTKHPFNEISGRIHLIDFPEQIPENGLIVDVLSSHEEFISPMWREIARFQQPKTLFVSNPSELTIYRVLDSLSAERLLAQGKNKFEQSPEDLSEITNLLGAAVNANTNSDQLLVNTTRQVILAIKQYDDLNLDIASLNENTVEIKDKNLGLLYRQAGEDESKLNNE